METVVDRLNSAKLILTPYNVWPAQSATSVIKGILSASARLLLRGYVTNMPGKVKCCWAQWLEAMIMHIFRLCVSMRV